MACAVAAIELFFLSFHMKINGELHDNLSEKQKVYGINIQRNLNGWFDRIWDAQEFREPHRDALLAGNAVVARNETCSAMSCMMMHGDLLMVIVHKGETKGVIIDRLSGEKREVWNVKHDSLG